MIQLCWLKWLTIGLLIKKVLIHFSSLRMNENRQETPSSHCLSEHFLSGLSWHLFLPVLGFEPQIFDVGMDRFANCATTTALVERT